MKLFFHTSLVTSHCGLLEMYFSFSLFHLFTISSMPFSFCFCVSLPMSVSLSGEGGAGTKAAAGGGEEEARGGREEAAGRDCASAEISRRGGQDERKAKLSGQCRPTKQANLREYQLLVDQWPSQSAVCQWILSDITCTLSVLRLRKCLKRQVFTLISETSQRWPCVNLEVLKGHGA